MKNIYLEGNNGGDYIKIAQTKEQEKISCCNIEIGHCCVLLLNAQVPIEFITSLFANFVLMNKEGFSRSMQDKLSDFAEEVMDFDKNYIKERLSNVIEH